MFYFCTWVGEASLSLPTSRKIVTGEKGFSNCIAMFVYKKKSVSRHKRLHNNYHSFPTQTNGRAETKKTQMWGRKYLKGPNVGKESN